MRYTIRVLFFSSFNLPTPKDQASLINSEFSPLKISPTCFSASSALPQSGPQCFSSRPFILPPEVLLSFNLFFSWCMLYTAIPKIIPKIISKFPQIIPLQAPCHLHWLWHSKLSHIWPLALPLDLSPSISRPPSYFSVSPWCSNSTELLLGSPG